MHPNENVVTSLSETAALPKTYDAAEVEPRRYRQWIEAGVFHADPDPARPPFVISMPPPNVTGPAHLGHASTYTPMDVLTRFHRMLGECAVWLPGQDHAAIATETVVIRELAREGTTREALGRAKYIERVWQWREAYGGEINRAFRSMGFGPDWARERFTMDEELSAAVNRVFVQLYREGLIYRGTRLINWDVASQSTLSDAEIVEEERDGTLWFVRYPAEDGSFSIAVATTRPETMLGDTAVAVHPEDERYAAFVGKRVIVPLTGRAVPVVADASVEPAFGTGAVKVTPAHDYSDNELGTRHKLPMISVIGFDAKITDEAPAPYRSLDRYAAREAVVRDLKAEGALVRSEPYRHVVPVSDRSGDVVEPLLSLQWFCRMESLAEPALEAYRTGRVRFVPDRFGRTYVHWLENIRDWNVSRQVWWGHQLPVWYGPNDEVVVAETEPEAYEIARREHGIETLRRDLDTLDTWFSSALWPFSILGWPDATPELRCWYPNSVLVTGREIIFLWVARMIMLGMKFAGGVPFEDVLITPLVFDDKGRKMSKSLGNAIDPLDLIRNYGADAVRMGILRQMRLESQEMRFDERFCEKSREFNNKMWNALRYVLALPEGLPPAGTLPPRANLGLADRWILTELAAAVRDVTAALERYEFGNACDVLLEFVWYKYCDWYLEATKAASETRSSVLSFTLNTAMRLLHPIAPFVTEEIWQALPHDGATIVTASWPEADEIPVDPAAHARYEKVRRAVTRARDARADLGVPPREKIEIEAPPGLEAQERALLALHANAAVVEGKAAGAGADPIDAATVRAPASLMRERFNKELQRLDREVERLEVKLANEGFVSKASHEIVSKERAKLAGYVDERARVREALDRLEPTGDRP